jgi:hypothetical protein
VNKKITRREIRDLMGAKIEILKVNPPFYFIKEGDYSCWKKRKNFLRKKLLVLPLNCKKFRVKGVVRLVY